MEHLVQLMNQCWYIIFNKSPLNILRGVLFVVGFNGICQILYKVIHLPYKYHTKYYCTRLCPILCGPVDWSLPGSSVPGHFQARILELLPFPTPGISPAQGVNPHLLHLLHCKWFFTTVPPGKPKILSLPWKFPLLAIFTSPTKPSEIIFFICVVLHCLECHVADMTYTRHTMYSLFRLVSFT